MTKWKKEIKRHGFKLEKDLPMVPFGEILGIYPALCDEGIRIITEYTFIVSECVIDRSGCIKYNTL